MPRNLFRKKKAHQPMSLERGEIQLLVFLAKNRLDPKAPALLEEFASKMSPEAQEIARAIMAIKELPGQQGAQESIAEIFVRRAETPMLARAVAS